MTSWATFFDTLGHESPLYREQSRVFVDALIAEVGVDRRHRVLDFGCGFGFVAAQLAPLVGEVWLWDPSPNMRSLAARNTAACGNARLCELSPDRERLPRMDLILVNSVAQYMARDEFTAWLVRWRDMLARDGTLVVSDLIPTNHRGVSDIRDLVWLGARHGSPIRATREALGGVAHYWRTRRSAPLTRIDADDLRRRAAAAGLDLATLPRNLTHFSGRWTAVLKANSRDLVHAAG